MGQTSSGHGGDTPEPCNSRINRTNHSSSNSTSNISCHDKDSIIDENGGGSATNASRGVGGVEPSAALMTQIHVGRTFETLGSANETWDSVVASLLAALRAEGHNCLMRRNKKKVRRTSEPQSVRPGEMPACSTTGTEAQLAELNFRNGFLRKEGGTHINSLSYGFGNVQTHRFSFAFSPLSRGTDLCYFKCCAVIVSTQYPENAARALPPAVLLPPR